MPPTCALCRHPKRPEVDQALAAGTALRDIAGQFGTSKSALDRHRDHIVTAITKAEDARAQLSAAAILRRLARLEMHAEEVLSEARREKDPRLVLNAIKELREQVEAVGRLARDVAAARGSAAERAQSSESFQSGAGGRSPPPKRSRAFGPSRSEISPGSKTMRSMPSWLRFGRSASGRRGITTTFLSCEGGSSRD